MARKEMESVIINYLTKYKRQAFPKASRIWWRLIKNYMSYIKLFQRRAKREYFLTNFMKFNINFDTKSWSAIIKKEKSIAYFNVKYRCKGPTNIWMNEIQ